MITKFFNLITSHSKYGIMLTLFGLFTSAFGYMSRGVVFEILGIEITRFYIGLFIIVLGLVVLVKQVQRCGSLHESTRRSRVCHKIIKECRVCPYVLIKPNIWDKKQFTYQCTKSNNSFIYMPTTIPWWCKYAIK